MSQKLYGKCRILTDWADWEPSIHAAEEQLDRQRWSQTYPFTFQINASTRTGIFSSTSCLPYYDTTLSHCTCCDFQARKLPCKHIYRLAQELGVIEIVNLRTDPEHLQAVKTARKARLEELKANPDELDEAPEQQRNIRNAAKCTILSLDPVEQTAIFQGSKNKRYQTTVDSCTCPSYFTRHLPCKHIYRLRMELAKIADEQED